MLPAWPVFQRSLQPTQTFLQPMIWRFKLSTSCSRALIHKFLKNFTYIGLQWIIIKYTYSIHIFHIFYLTTKHEILQITNHSLLCSLDPPNQGRLVWVVGPKLVYEMLILVEIRVYLRKHSWCSFLFLLCLWKQNFLL